MLKVIIEILIGVAWAAFGAYMAKKPKNTKVYKRSDYSSDGTKRAIKIMILPILLQMILLTKM